MSMVDDLIRDNEQNMKTPPEPKQKITLPKFNKKDHSYYRPSIDYWVLIITIIIFIWQVYKYLETGNYDLDAGVEYSAGIVVAWIGQIALSTFRERSNTRIYSFKSAIKIIPKEKVAEFKPEDFVNLWEATQDAD